MTDREPRYVCSACGFSRTSVEAVAQHVKGSHPDEDARILEYQSSENEGSLTWLGKAVKWVKGLFQE